MINMISLNTPTQRKNVFQYYLSNIMLLKIMKIFIKFSAQKIDKNILINISHINVMINVQNNIHMKVYKIKIIVLVIVMNKNIFISKIIKNNVFNNV